MRIVLLFLVGVLGCMAGFSQKKILILGSSTSTCFFGPSSLENCYVTRLQRHFEASGIPVIIDNRAEAGDNVYQAMPLNSTPPPGRQSPRPFKNITEGLQGNPDVVLVNFPSNGYDVFSVEEVLVCLRTIKQAANAAGKPCYITTSQPRNDPESFRTAETRSKMAQIKNSVLGEFGEYAINFWDEIVDPADNTIKPQYNADGTHLNDAGHFVLFTRVRDKNILTAAPPVSTPGGGLTYRYYEGYWDALPDFNQLSPVKTGSSGNLDLSVRNRNDYFGMVWEGTITIPVSGYYTFELNSDDGSRFYLNSGYNPGATPLLNNDGLHGDQVAVTAGVYLNAGNYPCAAAFFEAYGNEAMRLIWSGPGISRQPVPNSAFGGTAQPVAGGLNYRYYEGDWNSLPNFNALSPVKSGRTGSIDLSPRNREDYFGMVWEGNLTIPVSGQYYFELESDDGSQFFFNSNYNPFGGAAINNDGLHGNAPAAGAGFYVNAGTYPVAASYFEKWGDQSMRLYWTGPGIPRQLVPSSAFGLPAGTAVNSQQVATTPASREPLLMAYPNPFADRILVDFELENTSRSGLVEIYDNIGQLVKRQSINTLRQGRNSLEISMKEISIRPQSIYLVTIKIPGAETKRFRVMSR
jgi:lysophospholipase L1-like esterase